jgi:ribosomal subunit interface protein
MPKDEKGILMEIVIHARNAQLAADFRGIVSEKLNSLDRFSVIVDSIKVEVMHESNPRFGKSSHAVALTTNGSGPFLRAEGQAFNDLAAFDLAVKSLELQLRKTHERKKEYVHDSLRRKEAAGE